MGRTPSHRLRMGDFLPGQRQHIGRPTLLKTEPERGADAIAGIGDHDRRLQLPLAERVEQTECQAPLLLVHHLVGHPCPAATLRCIRPLARQIQLPVQRAGRGVGGGMDADRDLARFRGELAEFVADVFASLPRRDQRRWGACYLRGLMDGRRKSIQPMAERARTAAADRAPRQRRRRRTNGRADATSGGCARGQAGSGACPRPSPGGLAPLRADGFTLGGGQPRGRSASTRAGARHCSATVRAGPGARHARRRRGRRCRWSGWARRRERSAESGWREGRKRRA